jgi:hypothetical protein
MKWELDRFFIIILAIIFLSGCGSVISLNQESITEISLSHSGQKTTDSHGLSIKFLGNTTLAIEDNNSGIIIDGFLTRPCLAKLFFGSVRSEPDIVNPILCRAGISKKTQAIIPLHSHFDHILDAPYLAKELDACIVADKVARVISKREEPLKFCEKNIELGDDNYLYGEFHFRVIDGVHLDNGFVARQIAELNDKGEHDSINVNNSIDFSKSQRASSYKEGRTINVFVEHKKNAFKIFIVSGSFDSEDKVSIESFNEADVVFMSVPLMNKRKNTSFYNLVEKLLNKPAMNKEKSWKKKIVPFHWDNLSRKIPINASSCKTNAPEDFSYKERRRLLKPAPVLRRAISDLEALIDSSRDQNFELLWMTAFDQIRLTDG